MWLLFPTTYAAAAHTQLQWLSRLTVTHLQGGALLDCGLSLLLLSVLPGHCYVAQSTVRVCMRVALCAHTTTRMGSLDHIRPILRCGVPTGPASSMWLGLLGQHSIVALGYQIRLLAAAFAFLACGHGLGESVGVLPALPCHLKAQLLLQAVFWWRQVLQG